MYRQHNPIPPGWFECPSIGEVSDMHPMIPMKVPLGNTVRYPDMEQRSHGQWTPFTALATAHAMIVQKDPAALVGMVLDLSNSDKYYDYREIEGREVRYVKVPCRGRGVSPEPLAVNMAVWEIRKTLAANSKFYILVHCTHGFNRSGFIIVCAAMRLLADKGYCVERGIRYFKEQRPPGIYKNDYITDLFTRHNEARPRIVLTPDLPQWKPGDDDEEDERQGYNQMPVLPPAARLTHSDKVGEPVCAEEMRYIMNAVYDVLQGQDNLLKGIPLLGFPHQEMTNRSNGDLFIGSQPVSLDIENLNLVKLKRYFVTWKADGTRYLMLLLREGVYLIDRAGEVRRTHMRFPTLLPQPAKPGQYPVGPPHHWTLLDGEMVVDDLPEEDKQRRRYLVYDCMMLAGEGISDLSFEERYKIIEKQLMRPVAFEKEFYKKAPNPKFRYDWNMELCSIRRKEFWPLYKARKLLEDFIPTLCHESDGLILQPWDDPYIPRTYPHLLKWKFSHMNSVDFKLFALPDRPVQLQLNCAMRRKYGTAEINHMSLQDIGLGEQRVEFPEGVNPLALHGKIVECNFDPKRRVWTYMRERPDKLTANHRSVFDKVMGSIFDNITEDVLLAVFDEALQTRPDIYKEEKQWMNNPPAAAQLPGTAAGAAAAAHQGHAAAHQQQQHQPQQHQHNPQPHHPQQHHPQPQQQQQHMQQLQQPQYLQQQQRSQTPEVQQQQQQQFKQQQGVRGPSLTPPPGVGADEEAGGRLVNGHYAGGNAADNGLVDDLTPGLETDRAEGGEVDMEQAEEGVEEGGAAAHEQLYDQEQQQDEDLDGGDGDAYKVTEEDGDIGEGDYNPTEAQNDGED